MTPLRPHVKRDLKEKNEGVPPVQQPIKHDLNDMNEGATPLRLPGIYNLSEMNSIRFSRYLTLHISGRSEGIIVWQCFIFEIL